ncbi:MAG: DUF1905 domain-containing protein [Lewinellaceae bacterium]|nr:DUF1905 domain-containing protein [Lewinellaceae bacterium]
MNDSYQFKAVIEKFNSRLWTYHFKVPGVIAAVFKENNASRVVCTLNGQETFQCAIMPWSDGIFFINVNKKLRDKLGLSIGSPVQVDLRKDESQYGLPMPEELDELLKQDEPGDDLFQALTPGKKRTLLHFIGSVKNPDLRMHRALLVVEHLKENNGKIDFKYLYANLKP